MSSETFSQMLKRLRLSKTVTTVTITVRGRTTRTVERTVDLSQNELAARSGLTSGGIWRLEDGTNMPRRATVLVLAEVLELDQADTDRLLIAAGFVPGWIAELDDERLTALLAEGSRLQAENTTSADVVQFDSRRTG